MTLNEKKPSLLFGQLLDEINQPCKVIYIEIEDKETFLLAELIAEDSTVRDRKAFYQDYPGCELDEDTFEHQFVISYDRVREFADTHNLKYNFQEF